MALDYTPRDIASGFQTTESLDQNFADIQEALQDGLSRSGQSPNDMGADIDMQGHRIYNLPAAIQNGEPVTYAQLIANLTPMEFAGYLQELQTSTDGQTVFTTSNAYTPGLGALRVFVNGLLLPTTEYVENDANTVTFVTGLEAGDEVHFVITSFAAADYDTAATVQYLQPDGTYTTVQAQLDKFYARTAAEIAAGVVPTAYQYEPGDVRRYGAVGDGVTDCLSAFEDAVAVGNSVYVPDTGDNAYYISAPIASAQNMALFGTAEGQIASDRCSRIYAPEGFLVNETASRHIISLENIEVYGQGRAVAGKIGISGQFGGALKGVYLRGFDVLMQNNMAYLLDFVRCKFEDANIGLYLSTANETNVVRCFFQSTCLKPIDTYNLTPGAGGSKAALPFSVTGTNFNFGASAVPSVFSGQLIFTGNYSEVFATLVGSTALYEYVAMRFANATIYVADNHLNGQARADRCWHIYSDNVSGAIIKGQITRNWMRGYNELPVLIGDKADFYNLVSGIDIFENQVTASPYISFDSTLYRVPKQQIALLVYDGSLSVAGTSFIPIPFTVGTGFIAKIVGTSYRVYEPGLYRITADVVLSYNGAYRGCESRIVVNGLATENGTYIQTLPAVVTGGANYNTMHLEGLAVLAAGDDVQISVRNGELVTKARMTIELIPGAGDYSGY